jgi:hypothetical protein
LCDVTLGVKPAEHSFVGSSAVILKLYRGSIKEFEACYFCTYLSDPRIFVVVIFYASLSKSFQIIFEIGCFIKVKMFLNGITVILYALTKVVHILI